MFHACSRASNRYPEFSTAYVAQKTTKILYSGRAHHSLVPALVGFARWVRVLPIWIRVWAQDNTAIASKDVKPLDPFKKSDMGVDRIFA